MLAALHTAFRSLQQILLPGDNSAGTIVAFVVSGIVGLVAAVAFYYFQSIDGDRKPYSELETLNAHHEAEQVRKTADGHRATPVFSSHEGAYPSQPEDKLAPRR